MSETKEYFVKRSTKFTNADAKVIGPVLGELAEKGPVSARDIIEIAHSPNHPLHSYFEWDDKKAAEAHRLGIAREMVRTIKVRVTYQEDKTKRYAAQRVTVRSSAEKVGKTYYSAGTETEEAYRETLGKRALNDDYIPKSWNEALDIIRRLRMILKAKGDVEKPNRRFEDHAELDPENVRGLANGHKAIESGHTLFPSTVTAVKDSPRLLVSGANSRKLGDRVTKGPWCGFPIFQLSLEERATCPRACFHWNTCYGNGMQLARRHKNDENLIPYLRAELVDLQDEYPRGFVVRLHVLGDFYSPEYVKAWQQFLTDFPALHVFGYTAWPKDSEIGGALKAITDKQWDRFAIRFSSSEPQEQGATTIWRMPEDDRVWEGIVCPAQTEKTACCGTCGLCWAATAKTDTIAFIAHGPKSNAPMRGPTKAQLMGKR